MASTPDVRVARMATRQYGLITLSQVLSCGLTRRGIEARLRSGRWQTVHPGVYRIAGTERSWRQAVLAACFSAGPLAAASHMSAAVVHSLIDPKRRTAIEVTVPFGKHPAALGFAVHRSRLDFEPVFVGPIPLTSAPRTILDIAAILPEPELEEALDVAIRRGSVVPFELLGWLDALTGRRGLGVLRKLLGIRASRRGQNDGVFATRFGRMLRDHGLPEPELEHEIRGRGGRLIGRVDLCYPRERIAIELDGFEYHSSPAAVARDRRRQNALLDAGFTVRRFAWTDLDRPKHAAGIVRRALWERGHPDVVSL